MTLAPRTLMTKSICSVCMIAAALIVAAGCDSDGADDTVIPRATGGNAGASAGKAGRSAGGQSGRQSSSGQGGRVATSGTGGTSGTAAGEAGQGGSHAGETGSGCPRDIVYLSACEKNGQVCGDICHFPFACQNNRWQVVESYLVPECQGGRSGAGGNGSGGESGARAGSGGEAGAPAGAGGESGRGA
jgi:hypothetical protein